MSDQPQHPQDSQEDILDRIMNKNPAYSPPDGPNPEEPGQDVPNGPAPPQPVSGKKAAADDRKNKRSSVYIYLLVLFGAAFLMLLLAYFVQQRNNESLRNSMNLSRDELLQEIEAQKEENENLKAITQAMTDAQEEADARREELESQNGILENQYEVAEWSHSRATALSFLERFCAQGDWLMAACVVEDCDAMFNLHNPEYGPAAFLPAAVAERYLQLREDVLEKAGSLVAERTYPDPDDQEHYSEQVSIDPDASRYGGETVETARQLWPILHQYAMGEHRTAAKLLRFFCNSDRQYREQLEASAFQPSTLELFQQMKDDLIQIGAIKEDENGNMILPTLYGEDGGGRISPDD